MSGRGRSPGSRDDPIVKVRGLPYETTALDLCKFFTDCRIKDGPRGIFFALNDRKQPTGEAFILLDSFRDIDMAMRRHKDRIGSRYVEVFEAKRSVLDREIRNGATNEFGFNENRKDRPRDRGMDRGGMDRGGLDRGMDRGRMVPFGRGGGFGGGVSFRDRSPIRGFGRDRSPVRGFGRDRSPLRVVSRDLGPPRSKASDFCIKLRGLPWSATKEDIVDFLPDCHVAGGADGVVFIMDDKKDRPSGDAYVEMEGDEDVALALKNHKKSLGSRYVEVFEANPKDVARAKDKEDASRMRKDCFMVNLRGLPYSSTARDVEDWLSEVAQPKEVILLEDRSGRSSGQANAYFKTEKEAKSVAREMHRRDLGSRYIECFYESPDSD